jgi:thioesterase domain-containing protein
MAGVQSRLGHNLPLAALFEAPTVEALAAAVQRRMEAGEERCLVPLREEGAEPPLFLIAGVGGHVFTFHKFARLLGDDRPAYGVKAIGADGREEPPDRVEAIAARYVEEIEEERPHGPVVLGGYSVGALIAYEAAVQLQARGRDVGPVAVFDMVAPGYPRPMAWPRRMAIHLRNLLTGRAKAAYLRQRFANLREKVLRRLGLGRLAAPPVVEWVDSLPQEALRKVWAALRTAQTHYRPLRRFDGPVLLLKAAVGPDWPGAVFDDPLMGWGRWADKVRVTELPGTHLELFRDANLQPMADALRRQLADLG